MCASNATCGARGLADMDGQGNTYPARFTLDPPDEITQWRPVVQWFVAIPHLLVLNALQAPDALGAIRNHVYRINVARHRRGRRRRWSRRRRAASGCR